MTLPARTPGTDRSHGGAGLSTLLVHSGTLLTLDDAGTIVRGDLLVRDGVIAALGADVPGALGGREPDARLDASGQFVMPGLVQGHLHLCQTLFRGLAEQNDLLRWLRESIWPLEAAHTPASLAASVRLGVLDLLASGVTCVNDMGTVRHTESIGETLESAGIRAVFGKALMDRGEGVPAGMLDTPAQALAEVRALADRFDGAGGGRLRASLAPRFVLSCSPGMWEGAVALSRERDLLLHTHVSESPAEGREVAEVTGTTAGRWFDGAGVLSKRFVAAHGVWLESDELAAFARADAALVHCPGSNLKLGSGLARVRAWRDAGIRCGLGSDGAACNNRLDPFVEMGLAAGVSRVRDAAHPLGAREVVALATRDGAAALGLGAVTGRLAPGFAADVIGVDPRGAHHGPEPEADPWTALVHSARGTDVRFTMVAGRVLYRDGAWSTLDPDAVLAESRHERRGLLRRVEPAA